MSKHSDNKHSDNKHSDNKHSDNKQSNNKRNDSNSDNVVNFDLNYLAENQPSMCIPRVFENISESQVRDVFEQLDL